MSVVDKTEKSQTDTIAFEVELAHAPEKVWRALTQPELLKEWLLPVIGWKLERGNAFTFKTQAYPGWDGTVNCQILDIEENRKISYTWTVPFLDTVLTFELLPSEKGTTLSIVQSGFKWDQKQEFGGARYGWTMMGGKLVELLARIA